MKNFAEFLVSKSLTEETMKTKSAEEVAGLYNEYNDLKRTELDSAIEGKASKDSIIMLQKELSTMKDAQMTVLKEHGIALKKLNDGLTAENFNEVMSVKGELSKNVEQLKAIKGGSNDKLRFKVAGTITGANVSGGNVPVEQRIAGFDDIASRRTRLLDIVSTSAAESNIISWVSKANRDGAAGATGEGLAKNQIDFDWVVASEALKKITAYIKVSQEMLEDVSFMESAINAELIGEVMRSVEAGVYEGAGTGILLNGIKTVATAFSAGSHALAVDNANEADVLVVANEQIELAEHDAANYILMNPADVNKLLLIKASATDKRYIDRLVMIAGNMSLDGIPILKTTLVTVGTYLVGDFTKAFVYSKGMIDVQVGLENDDFTKNLVTILAEWRGLSLVKTNDRTAFVTGVFATDKAALETA